MSDTVVSVLSEDERAQKATATLVIYSRIWRILASKVLLLRSHIPIESEAIKMPTVERIRELCAKVVDAKNPQEFDLLLLELSNALSTYSDIQLSDQDKAAEA